MNYKRLTTIPAIRLQVYCNPAPVPRCCPWNVSVPMTFINIRNFWYISQPLQHTHNRFQTHINIKRYIEHVYNVPKQQVIRRFSSCDTEKCDTGERCTSGRGKWLTVSMERHQKLRYSLVNIIHTRFLPRKGNSMRYPPNKNSWTPIDVWMNC